MKKTIFYTYLGTNGTITSPVFLENIYSVKKYQLLPEDGYQLTKDGKKFFGNVMIPESDLPLWMEVKGQ